MVTLSKKSDCNGQLSNEAKSNPHCDTDKVQGRSMTLLTPKITCDSCSSDIAGDLVGCHWNCWQIE